MDLIYSILIGLVAGFLGSKIFKGSGSEQPSLLLKTQTKNVTLTQTSTRLILQILFLRMVIIIHEFVFY